jgi:hypothetical protein
MVLTLLLMLRLGLFATAVFAGSSMLIDWTILNFRFDSWYGQSSLVAGLALAGLTTWAFWTSIGRPTLATVGRSA